MSDERIERRAAAAARMMGRGPAVRAVEYELRRACFGGQTGEVIFDRLPTPGAARRAVALWRRMWPSDSVRLVKVTRDEIAL